MYVVSKISNDQIIQFYGDRETGANFDITNQILVRGMQSVHRGESEHNSTLAAVTEYDKDKIEELEKHPTFKEWLESGFVAIVKSDSVSAIDKAIASLTGVDKSEPYGKKELLDQVKSKKHDIDVEFNKAG